MVFFKIKLITLSLINSFLLLIVLCLGSQNLNDRHKVNMIFGTTADLPNGFLIGISIVVGVISGGSSAAIISPTQFNKEYIRFQEK